jgi:1,4-dihydroxy-2-naphthoate octaprenyltransferase
MVKLLLRFFDVIIYTSIFTACCAVGLCMATEKLIDPASVHLITKLHLLIFGSTLLVYNIPRLLPSANGTQAKSSALRKWYLLFCVVGLLLTSAALYGQPLPVLILCASLGTLAFSYFLPVLPFGTKKRLRDYGWLKICVLTGVWTLATTVLPMVAMHKQATNYPLEIAMRFAFVFVLCLLFDIRDIETDLNNNIRTLPHKMGLAMSYRFIGILLIVFAVFSALQFFRFADTERLYSSLFTALATAGIVAYLKESSDKRAFVLLADGPMLLYSICILAF